MSGKPGLGVQSHPSIGSHAANRSAADDFIALGQRDCNAAGAGYGLGSFGHQLQHFVQHELFKFPIAVAGTRARCMAARFFRSAPPNLFMQG